LRRCKNEYIRYNIFFIAYGVIIATSIIQGGTKMSNYDHKLEGLELMYHLMKRFDYTYIQAKNEMIRHNQDMEFIKELNIEGGEHE
tara:strand:+ start:55 stop:312 length:258 start_codon:yes stop_codon:yes gene_type:complete